ncbi:MAG TPA: monovalent cation/H+ antiporter subunit D, partial [Pseudomonas sp.]|nr:monovalent cation/H+ antiporter subunit D [Pseudomonas sp.]
VHSTLVSGGLFLLADLIARQRGDMASELLSAPALKQPLMLGALFFAGAISIAGLPPFSGFIGKVMLLQAVPAGVDALLLWPVVLVGGLGMVIALSRAGSMVFWRPSEAVSVGRPADRVRVVASFGLLLGSVLLVVVAQPIQAYMQATAAQLFDLGPYMQIIRGGEA